MRAFGIQSKITKQGTQPGQLASSQVRKGGQPTCQGTPPEPRLQHPQVQVGGGYTSTNEPR